MKRVRAVFCVGLIALIGSLFLACDEEEEKKSGAQVKHVILFIGDGMQLAHEIAASRYLYGSDNGLSFHAFKDQGGYEGSAATWDVSAYNKYATEAGAAAYDAVAINWTLGYDSTKGGPLPWPRLSVAENFSADAYFSKYWATDSASAGTALASGVKTDDGNINWLSGDPDNGSIITITQELKTSKSFAIGVATTVQFPHATPATFLAHNKSRNNYLELATEIINTAKPDVLIGAGHPGWEPTPYKYISEADYTALKSSTEYQFVERVASTDGAVSLAAAADAAIAGSKKLFGLYGGAQGLFEYHVPADNPGTPSVVRGSVENPALKDCVTAALKVLSRNTNGFFAMFEQGDIDWSNHGRNYANMIGGVYDLDEAVKVAMAYVDQTGDDVTWGNTVIIVTSDHANSYMRFKNSAALAKGDLPVVDGADASVYHFSGTDAQIKYGLGSHTNEPVMVYARGAGVERLKKYEGQKYAGTSLIDNTDINAFMREVTGL